jgi:predicted DNA-binding transcriptional regulator AlpA
MQMSSDDLLTVTAAAAVLGWSKQHAESYRQRGTFPEPDQYVIMGQDRRMPVWLRKTIEQYKKDRSPLE